MTAAAPPNSNLIFLAKAGIEEENEMIALMHWGVELGLVLRVFDYPTFECLDTALH